MKSEEQWWNDTDRGKTEGLVETPVSVPIRPPQVSYGI